MTPRIGCRPPREVHCDFKEIAVFASRTFGTECCVASRPLLPGFARVTSIRRGGAGRQIADEMPRDHREETGPRSSVSMFANGVSAPVVTPGVDSDSSMDGCRDRMLCSGRTRAKHVARGLSGWSRQCTGEMLA